MKPRFGTGKCDCVCNMKIQTFCSIRSLWNIFHLWPLLMLKPSVHFNKLKFKSMEAENL